MMMIAQAYWPAIFNAMCVDPKAAFTHTLANTKAYNSLECFLYIAIKHCSIVFSTLNWFQRGQNMYIFFTAAGMSC